MKRPSKRHAWRQDLKNGEVNGPFLIHLPKDPGELQDLASREPDKAKEMVQEAEALVRGVMSGEPLEIHSPPEAKK